MITRDNAFKSVVKLETPVLKNGRQEIIIGTGFFLGREDNNKIFLITADHVAKDFNDKTIVSMAGIANNISKILLRNLKNSSGIIKHSSADICVIGVERQALESIQPSVIIFSSNLINQSKIHNITRDEELTSIGFPKGLGISSLFQPLSFRSFPSSNIIRNIKYDNGQYSSDIFFLENPGCGGYSGCPVIDLGYRVTGAMSQTSDTWIYGVMHGTLYDDTGGKMALVVPAYYLLELI